jgi:hypothetical protein
MSRNYGEPANGLSKIGAGLSGAIAGVRLSYVCPADKQAVVLTMGTAHFVGKAPVIQHRATIGDVTAVLFEGELPQVVLHNCCLNAGDSVDLFVVAPGDNFDGHISVEEYLVA